MKCISSTIIILRTYDLTGLKSQGRTNYCYVPKKTVLNRLLMTYHFTKRSMHCSAILIDASSRGRWEEIQRSIARRYAANVRPQKAWSSKCDVFTKSLSLELRKTHRKGGWEDETHRKEAERMEDYTKKNKALYINMIKAHMISQRQQAQGLQVSTPGALHV